MKRLLLAALIPTLLVACTQPTKSGADASSSMENDQAMATDAGMDDSSMASGMSSLQTAVDGDWRDADNVARDSFRHPAQTLEFFGVKPDQTVIEIVPGGGWYAQILAPYLQQDGEYIAAVVDPAAVEGKSREYQAKTRSKLEEMFAAKPAQYTATKIVGYDPNAPVFGAPGSADTVVTFRNVHNWRGDGQAEGMFKGFFAVLKPGGTLGVVEHRADGDVADDDKSGYVGQDQVIAYATNAGFVLDEKSEINANPKDTKDHPNGVWTLPPSNNHDDADDVRFKAIGESDRMTLRFKKPA